GLNLRVQAVRVGPRELLRHRDDGRKLDRGERPGTPADARGRLDATLALLVGGTPADLADLGALRVHRDNGLAVADRDLLTRTEGRRASLRLLGHWSDVLLGQDVARKVRWTSLVVAALAAGRGLIRLNLVQSSHLLISSLPL